MKRNYTTPTIEKIAFRYRDQVVTASGGEVVIEAGESWGDFLGRLLNDGFQFADIVELWKKLTNG